MVCAVKVEMVGSVLFWMDGWVDGWMDGRERECVCLFACGGGLGVYGAVWTCIHIYIYICTCVYGYVLG